MEIVKITTKNGKNYSIVNESWETSRAWGHRSVLLSNNSVELGENKVRYYNRTWEMYRYQSCMLGLIEKLLTDNQKSFLAQYKEMNDIARFTPKEKKIALEKWAEIEYVEDLQEIMERIHNRNFD